LKSCILCGKVIKKDTIVTHSKIIKNSNYKFNFDKENCFLFFKKLANVYGEEFELDNLDLQRENTTLFVC
jgi:hypothetical protein